MASSSHELAKTGLDFGGHQSTQGYRSPCVYARSKLANILFTTELAHRLEGTGITANCLHPGTVRSGLAQNGDAGGLWAIGMAIANPFMTSPEKGVATSVYLAWSPSVAATSGAYFAKCKEVAPTQAATDPVAARRLWDVSEEMARP